MPLKNGVEVVGESVSALDCKQKKVTLANLSRIRPS